jgi:hypothetical protein
MLHAHLPEKPRVFTCSQCHRPLVLIDYYGKLLKGCLSCNKWGRPGGNLWTRLPQDDLRALHGMMHDQSRPAGGRS